MFSGPSRNAAGTPFTVWKGRGIVPDVVNFKVHLLSFSLKISKPDRCYNVSLHLSDHCFNCLKNKKRIKKVRLFFPDLLSCFQCLFEALQFLENPYSECNRTPDGRVPLWLCLRNKPLSQQFLHMSRAVRGNFTLQQCTCRAPFSRRSISIFAASYYLRLLHGMGWMLRRPAQLGYQ